MSYIIQATLSNALHPEYGVATIPLPLPKGEYDHSMAVLEALEIGDAVRQDCKVEEIAGGYRPVHHWTAPKELWERRQ